MDDVVDAGRAMTANSYYKQTDMMEGGEEI